MLRLGHRLRALVRLVTGEDIFISYARIDGARYAVGLAEKLEQRGFTYYFDRLGSPPGVELPEKVKAHARNASMLVVVCTPGAEASVAIRQEIESFRTTGGTMMLVGDGAVGRALIPGLAVIADDIADGPSTAAVADVARAFVHTRLMVVRRRIVLTSAAVLTISAITVGAWLRSAEKRVGDARTQLRVIEKSRDEVTRARNEAETQRAAAVRARQTAEAERRTAVEERGLAVAQRALAVTERDRAARCRGRRHLRIRQVVCGGDAQPRAALRAQPRTTMGARHPVAGRPDAVGRLSRRRAARLHGSG